MILFFMKFNKKQITALAGMSLFEGIFILLLWYTACYVSNSFQVCEFPYNGIYELLAISFVLFLIHYYISEPTKK